MGRLWMRAVERAGLSALAERALQGRGLDPAELATLRASDLLVVAGLADAVRERHRGDEVRLIGLDQARQQPDLVRLQLDPGRSDGPTGQELLFEIAIARLAQPADRAIGVSLEQLGLQLAQTALAFGADTLIADLGSKRTLPLLDSPAARRDEISGLLQRVGRRVRFVEASEAGELIGNASEAGELIGNASEAGEPMERPSNASLQGTP